MSQSRSNVQQEIRVHGSTRSRTSDMIDSVYSGRQRTRAQTAAYLLGIRPELPSIIDTTEQTSQELDKSKL